MVAPAGAEALRVREVAGSAAPFPAGEPGWDPGWDPGATAPEAVLRAVEAPAWNAPDWAAAPGWAVPGWATPEMPARVMPARAMTFRVVAFRLAEVPAPVRMAPVRLWPVSGPVRPWPEQLRLLPPTMRRSWPSPDRSRPRSSCLQRTGAGAVPKRSREPRSDAPRPTLRTARPRPGGSVVARQRPSAASRSDPDGSPVRRGRLGTLSLRRRGPFSWRADCHAGCGCSARSPLPRPWHRRCPCARSE